MDLDPIIRSGLLLAALIGILIVVRIVIVPDGVGFEDLFGIREDRGWPRGLQEEEPARWRPECLTPWRGRSPTPPSSTTPPTSTTKRVTHPNSGPSRRSSGVPATRRPQG